MNTNWEISKNPSEYVKNTLTKEAEDIPYSLIDNAEWIIQTINIAEIKVDTEMIKRDDMDQIHIKRRDNFIGMIKKGDPILPLIVLGKDKSLVDGYARYRALKLLDTKSIKILTQNL